MCLSDCLLINDPSLCINPARGYSHRCVKLLNQQTMVIAQQVCHISNKYVNKT